MVARDASLRITYLPVCISLCLFFCRMTVIMTSRWHFLAV